MRDEDFGTIRIKLEEVIQQSSLSKNKVAQLSQTQRGQLNHYCKGDIQRIDLAILSRLCVGLPRGGCFGVYPTTNKEFYIKWENLLWNAGKHPQQVFVVIRATAGWTRNFPPILALSRGL